MDPESPKRPQDEELDTLFNEFCVALTKRVKESSDLTDIQMCLEALNRWTNLFKHLQHMSWKDLDRIASLKSMCMNQRQVYESYLMHYSKPPSPIVLDPEVIDKDPLVVPLNKMMKTRGIWNVVKGQPESFPRIHIVPPEDFTPKSTDYQEPTTSFVESGIDLQESAPNSFSEGQEDSSECQLELGNNQNSPFKVVQQKKASFFKSRGMRVEASAELTPNAIAHGEETDMVNNIYHSTPDTSMSLQANDIPIVCRTMNSIRNDYKYAPRETECNEEEPNEFSYDSNESTQSYINDYSYLGDPGETTINNMELACITEKVSDIWNKSQYIDYELLDDEISTLRTGFNLIQQVVSTKNLEVIDKIMRNKMSSTNNEENPRKRVNPFDIDASAEKCNLIQPPNMDSKQLPSKNRRSGKKKLLPGISLPFMFEEEDILPTKQMNWSDLLKKHQSGA